MAGSSIELDPAHVVTAIRRFERHSGEQVILVETELTFAALAEQHTAQANAETDHE